MPSRARSASQRAACSLARSAAFSSSLSSEGAAVGRAGAAAAAACGGGGCAGDEDGAFDVVVNFAKPPVRLFSELPKIPPRKPPGLPPLVPGLLPSASPPPWAAADRTATGALPAGAVPAGISAGSAQSSHHVSGEMRTLESGPPPMPLGSSVAPPMTRTRRPPAIATAV